MSAEEPMDQNVISSDFREDFKIFTQQGKNKPKTPFSKQRTLVDPSAAIEGAFRGDEFLPSSMKTSKRITEEFFGY